MVFERGKVIFKEGSYEPCMYDIIEGEVGIYINYGTSEEKNLTVLKAGDYFGEMGLIEGYPRSATAIALSEVKLSRIGADDFGSYFKSNPGRILSIMENMSHRLRDLTEDYMEACETITEYLKAEERHEEKAPGLLAKMRKFMQFYEKNK